MHIVFVLRGDSIIGGGGAERRFGRIFTYFNENKVDNIELTMVLNRELAKSLIESSIIKGDANLLYPNKQMNIIEFNLWLISKIKNLKPDIIHLPLLQKSLSLFYIWLLFNKKIPVVLTVASSLYAKNIYSGILNILVAKILYYRSNVIDSLYSYFVKYNGNKYKKKVKITPCSFTDYDMYKFNYKKKKIITFAGRLIREKNPLLLIEAINILQNIYNNLGEWKVNILGNGELYNEIVKKVKEYNLNNIISVNSVISTSQYMSESTIFVSLQKEENYPSQALIEAMACGNAIIATNVGDTSKMINCQNGILISEDANELADKLNLLMSNELYTAQLGINASKFVRENHTVDKFASYLVEIWSIAYGIKK